VGLVVLGIIIFVASRACGEDTSSSPQATSTPNRGYSGEPTVTPTPRQYVTPTPIGEPIIKVDLRSMHQKCIMLPDHFHEL